MPPSVEVHTYILATQHHPLQASTAYLDLCQTHYTTWQTPLDSQIYTLYRHSIPLYDGFKILDTDPTAVIL